jgi:hypothetical protein
MLHASRFTTQPNVIQTTNGSQNTHQTAHLALAAIHSPDILKTLKKPKSNLINSNYAPLLKQYTAYIGCTQRQREHRTALKEMAKITGGMTAEEALKDPIKFEFALARIAQQYPAPEIRKDLHVVHNNMKENFANMSDESLDYLLGGSDQMARGGFGLTPDGKANVKAFRKFLNADPADLPAHKLISGIESVCTAMGYRAIGASWTRAPHRPQTPDQTAMQNRIAQLVDPNKVYAIGVVYTNRGHDDQAPHLKPGEKGDVHIKDQPDQYFDKERPAAAPSGTHRDFRNESWVGEAAEQDIPVRGHVSGTAPLTTAALDGLMGNKSSKKWGENSMTKEDIVRFENMAALVTLPTFSRASYHTLSETVIGLGIYKGMHGYSQYENEWPQPTPPADAQKLAHNLIMSITSDEPIPGSSITYRDVADALLTIQFFGKYEKETKKQVAQQQAPYSYSDSFNGSWTKKPASNFE